VIGSSTTLNKNSSGAAAPASHLADEISLMRKIKAHLARCQCCKDAIFNSENIPENNSEAGSQPTPGATETTQTQQAKLGSACYNK
jgi:hypothetical protein